MERAWILREMGPLWPWLGRALSFGAPAHAFSIDLVYYIFVGIPGYSPQGMTYWQGHLVPEEALLELNSKETNGHLERPRRKKIRKARRPGSAKRIRLIHSLGR
jgi:hypothetical protein